MNLYERQQKFYQDLTQVCRSKGVVDAYVNSYLGTVCQDHMNFTPSLTLPDVPKNEKPWLSGSIGKINIWVDFSRRYSDQRLTDKEGNLLEDFTGKYGTESLI